MTQFLRLLKEQDKGAALASTAAHVRSGEDDLRHFEVEVDSFEVVPGAPFAYWVSDHVRETFQRLPAFEGDGRTVKQGLATAEDFRFVRGWWEVVASGGRWFPFAKGGSYSPFYADVFLIVNWEVGGAEIKAGICQRYPYLNGNPDYVAKNTGYYFRSGLTWGDRTSNLLSVKPWPSGGVFSVKGSAGFFDEDSTAYIMALMNSTAFNAFLAMLVSAGGAIARSYQVGVIGVVPYPEPGTQGERAAFLALRSWSFKRTLDTVTETSHAFLLPALLRPRLGPYDPPAIEAELARIQQEIDDICFDLYGFDEADRAAMTETTGSADETAATEGADDQEDTDDADEEISADVQSALLSWCVGVVFGRFDIRLATGERLIPPEPGPFDPLPAKSPSMLPDGAAPFHAHNGILVDDQGNPHDLAKLVEDVVEQVDTRVPFNVCDWLQRDFFAFHLQHYSKSRRRAPIYWPLSTKSAGYTLWVYYPSLTDQTLYTAINDFVEPKLKQVTAQLTTLGAKGSKRTHEEEKRLEELEDMEDEMTDLRDTLLRIAPTYHPNQDDGVQITAAPLWPLFRYKPWQKLLKETWAKLEKGDYDWAHLAMHYWPDRVRAKCTTDKSLSIAHGLEDLYVEPERHERTPRSRRQ